MVVVAQCVLIYRYTFGHQALLLYVTSVSATELKQTTQERTTKIRKE